MQSAPSSEIIPQLTLSVVLFHSPLEQLRALVESVIASLRAANLSGVQMVCWDNSCDVAYSAQCQQLLANFASQDSLAMTYVMADNNGGYGAGHNRAVSSCVGQFHLILNPDVQLSEEAIPLAMDLLTSAGAHRAARQRGAGVPRQDLPLGLGTGITRVCTCLAQALG